LSLDESNFDCSNIGANTVVLTVTDASGNASICTATLTVEDDTPPEAICQDLTIHLDVNGNAIITAADVNNGSNDACGVASLSIDQSMFNCDQIGTINTVTLTVADSSGNEASCTSTITVEDTIAPLALCEDIAVQLDASGNATITAADVDGGSNDACGIAGLSIDVSSFNCSNIGANDVDLTVTDNNGNAANCTAAVTVSDLVAPEALCQDITVSLDDLGSTTITTSDVDGGSNDACGIAGLAIDVNSFNCDDVGANTVTLTATDNNGNTASCTATVTIEDNTDPEALCENITVYLDAIGSAAITAGNVDGGSNDACGIDALTINKSSFGCDNVGSNNVVLTATDVNGNNANCTAVVTVVDTIAPVAQCQDITVSLDASGNATITTSDVDGGSNDACGIANLSIDINAFGCSDIGDNTVTLTVTDNNGNSSTCETTVTVEGIIPEVNITEDVLPAFCQGGTIVLAANSDDAVAYDWSTNETTQEIQVNADGTYSVTVTSATGCTASASYILSGYDPGSLISSYTILSTYGDVHLHGDNVVASGGVGVMKPGKKAKIHDDTYVETFVQADHIDINGGSTVANSIFAPATVTLPLFISNPYNSSNDVSVPNNTTVTLNDCIFDKLEIKKNATVTFTCDNIFINELKLKEGVTINFANSANMFINKGVKVHKYSSFNPTGQDVTMYVDHKFEVEYGSDVEANVYALGDIKAKGKKNKPTTMTGLFIGRKVDGKENVTWNWDTNCDPAMLPDFPEEPCDDCEGGVVALSLIYNGTSGAQITVTDKYGDDIYFDGWVMTGDTFSFVGEGSYNKLDKNTRVYINGNLDVTIHTSCSQPIGPGAEWGSFTVASARSKYNGPVCPVPPVDPEGCDDCKGGVVAMEMEYTGNSTEYVEVTGEDGDPVYYAGNVSPGDTISFEGTGSYNKLDKHTEIYVDGDLDEEVHTSCSQPIGPGVVFGDFTVTYAESKDNGPVCPETGGNDDDDDDDDHHGHHHHHHKTADAGIVSSAYPNPFKDKVAITFELPENSNVTIEIMTINGTVIHRKDLGELEGKKEHVFEFNATGRWLSSHSYYYRIISGKHVSIGELILIK